MSFLVVAAALAAVVVVATALPCPDPVVCKMHHSKSVFETSWADVLAELKNGFQPGSENPLICNHTCFKHTTICT